MGLLLIFGASVLLAAVLRRRFKKRILAWMTPPFLLVLAIVLAEFVFPDHGGGASFWPIAMGFGGAIALIGGLLGAFIVSRLRK